MLRKYLHESKIFSGFRNLVLVSCFSFPFCWNIFFCEIFSCLFLNYFHEEITESEWSLRTGGLDGGKSWEATSVQASSSSPRSLRPSGTIYTTSCMWTMSEPRSWYILYFHISVSELFSCFQITFIFLNIFPYFWTISMFLNYSHVSEIFPNFLIIFMFVKIFSGEGQVPDLAKHGVATFPGAPTFSSAPSWGSSTRSVIC